MEKSTLIKILKTFSKEEMAEFGDFITSPYHNKNTNVVKLYHALRKFAPGFTAANITKEKIGKKIFPGKDYNYGIMKNIIHETTKLAESYLSHRNFNSGLSFERHLIKELFKKQIYDVLNIRLKGFERKNETALSNSQDFFFNKVFKNDMKTNYLERNSLKPKDVAEDLKDLMMYFMDAIFEYGRMMYMGHQSINIAYDFRFIEYIMDYFEKNPELLEESLIVKFRYYGVLFHIRSSDENLLLEQIRCFKQLKNKLSPWDKYLAYQQIYWAYEMMRRKQVNKYEKDLIFHLIEMVEENIYSQTKDNYVPLNLFTNIVFVCIRNHEAGLLKEFVNKNGYRISPGIRASMLIYAYGNISFLEKDYKKALLLFTKTDNNFSESNKDNYYFKYSAKILILISLFELNYFEQVLTETDSFIHFLKNNKAIHNTIKPRVLNFVKFLKELTLLNLEKDDLKLGTLFVKINNFDGSVLSRKDWLLDKINELERTKL